MKKQLRKIAYQRAMEKYGEISAYHTYRINHEISRIQQMDGLDCILCMERILAIGRELGREVTMDQNAVKSSFICYLIGASLTNPIDADLRFDMPENLKDISSEQSLETVYAVWKAFTPEDEMLFFGAMSNDEKTEEPAGNR
ncbi:MAG TPA: hypothetical protein VN721_12305 [Flavipsychrobacter sp.]|nr:hypothetical protein [Flavipsychrobacter sp.]